MVEYKFNDDDIPKLEDAFDAGTNNSNQCTLILTEGDSAKSLVSSVLDHIGRDKYGIFPLQGILLNVRKQIRKNSQLNNIMKIIGLDYKKQYLTNADLEKLRYGKIMIMPDPDIDGTYFKASIINFMHFYWPSLLELNFFEMFITPCVKASNGENRSFIL